MIEKEGILRPKVGCLNVSLQLLLLGADNKHTRNSDSQTLPNPPIGRVPQTQFPSYALNEETRSKGYFMAKKKKTCPELSRVRHLF